MLCHLVLIKSSSIWLATLTVMGGKPGKGGQSNMFPYFSNYERYEIDSLGKISLFTKKKDGRTIIINSSQCFAHLFQASFSWTVWRGWGDLFVFWPVQSLSHCWLHWGANCGCHLFLGSCHLSIRNWPETRNSLHIDHRIDVIGSN